ncbi:BspA family leucine-rich repeat surface protein [Ruminococcus flavefaciens]|uniref:BspA family leucine-rich repeat surface protein n=1 Tax=Ruminococcus flavefaciens TaxID=1265 RepID=UPI00048C0072|nr:BspA family leucine-rich repeat surface protein [Ruminococcus flavefaciens]
MKKQLTKKAVTAIMAFALICGAAADNAYLSVSPIVAQAETSTAIDIDDYDHLDNYDSASFSEKTGVLLLNGKVNKQDVRQYCNNEKVKKVSCAKGTVFPVNCGAMFEGFYAKEFDFTNADLSKVDDMSNMFYLLNSGDAKIINLKASNATKMNYMFYNSPALESLELSGWDTSKVEDMTGVFFDCKKLESLDLRGWDTSNVENMSCMFEECNELRSLDLSSFDTSKVKDMSNMFIYCSSLKSLDVSNFDTSNAEHMQSMFSHCTSLETLDVSNFDTSNAQEYWTNTSCMFLDCTALYPNMVYCSEANMTLNGNLEINFYASQPEYYSKYYSGDLRQLGQNLAKIVMSGPNGDIEITDFDKFDLIYGKMKLTYPVNATQANEKITVRAYDKDGNRLIMCNESNGLCSHSQLECSVQSYINNLKQSSSYQNEEKLHVLVDALDNYCKAAENYFNGADNTITGIENVEAANVNNYVTDLGSDVKISLLLNSETALRIYTESENVLIDDKKATAKYKDGKKYYEIPNIGAHQLSTSHKITIDGKDYSCSALSYVNRVLNNPKNEKNPLLTDMAKATYIYAKAAEPYVTK